MASCVLMLDGKSAAEAFDLVSLARGYPFRKDARKPSGQEFRARNNFAVVGFLCVPQCLCASVVRFNRY